MHTLQGLNDAGAEDERLVRVAVLANGCQQEHGYGNRCSCCLACCVTCWTLFMNVLTACKKKDQSLSDINLPDMDPSSEFQFRNSIKTYCSIIQVIEFIVCMLQNTYDLFYIVFMFYLLVVLAKAVCGSLFLPRNTKNWKGNLSFLTKSDFLPPLGGRLYLTIQILFSSFFQNYKIQTEIIWLTCNN